MIIDRIKKYFSVISVVIIGLIGMLFFFQNPYPVVPIVEQIFWLVRGKL